MYKQWNRMSKIFARPWAGVAAAVVAGLLSTSAIAEQEAQAEQAEQEAEAQAEQAVQEAERAPVAASGEQAVPGIRLREARIDEVIESLRTYSRQADPEGHGVNFIYQGPPVEEVPRLTLSLRNVTLNDAIRHITAAAGLGYRIEPNAVVITRRDAPQGEIITRIYPVQPTIMDVVREQERRGGSGRVEDLFRW
jgi:type II secretory pathway pseudopilin PulG